MALVFQQMISDNLSGTRPVLRPDTPLTKAPDERRQWLPVRVHAPAVPAKDLHSLRSKVRWSRGWKCQPQMDALLASCFKIELISHSMLTHSFGSRPTFQTGKPGITNRLNAGDQFTVHFQGYNPHPAGNGGDYPNERSVSKRHLTHMSPAVIFVALYCT